MSTRLVSPVNAVAISAQLGSEVCLASECGLLVARAIYPHAEIGTQTLATTFDDARRLVSLLVLRETNVGRVDALADVDARQRRSPQPLDVT